MLRWWLWSPSKNQQNKTSFLAQLTAMNRRNFISDSLFMELICGFWFDYDLWLHFASYLKWNLLILSVIYFVTYKEESSFYHYNFCIFLKVRKNSFASEFTNRYIFTSLLLAVGWDHQHPHLNSHFFKSKVFSATNAQKTRQFCNETFSKTL